MQRIRRTAVKTRAPKSKARSSAASATIKLKTFDLQPTLNAIEKIRRDTYLSPERRRIPITV